MAKKRVSSVDLSWMIFERLRDELGNARPVSVAIVSDSELGWRAVLSRRVGRSINKAAIRKLKSIENEFRTRYSLAGD
jgi:hypothetical protein